MFGRQSKNVLPDKLLVNLIEDYECRARIVAQGFRIVGPARFVASIISIDSNEFKTKIAMTAKTPNKRIGKMTRKKNPIFNALENQLKDSAYSKNLIEYFHLDQSRLTLDIVAKQR